jgi:acyl carrier protein
VNTDSARAAVRAVLAQVAPEADLDLVDEDADLRAEIDLDSMDFLNLVEGIAESTGVDIPESDYARVRTLGSLTEYVALRSG